MNSMTIQYFTDQEEIIVDLLVKTGTQRNVARILVFLVKTPKASSRDLEHGTGLRQSEISVGMQFLIRKKWIDTWDYREKPRGRPMIMYRLSKKIGTILDSIQRDNEKRSAFQMARLKNWKDLV